MDTSNELTSDFISVFDSWSSSPDACLLHEASLHAKSFWNPTFGEKSWMLLDYTQYNHIFIQLEMLLKERVRCTLGINVGMSNLEDALAAQDYFINDLIKALHVPNDPCKEARLLNMWQDMEAFANRGIALKQKQKIKEKAEMKQTMPPNNKLGDTKPELTNITASQTTVNKNNESKPIKLEILNPMKELPQYWKISQEKLCKIEGKINNFLKSSVFKFLRQVAKDKNKIIINYWSSQNLLGKFQENYNIFPIVRIYQTNEKLISGLINYKYKRKRKMSEDAKKATYVNIFDHFKIREEENYDEKEKENRRLSMINQVDMALKYNNVTKVKQLMNDEDFMLLSDKDKNAINLKTRLAAMELFELKQLMEKEKMNKLKLSWEQERKEKEKNEADKKTN